MTASPIDELKSAYLTPIGVMCFPALYTPRPAAPGAAPRHSLILVFNDTALKTPQYMDLRKGVQAAVAEKWGAVKAQDPAFMRALRLPFRDTAEKDYAGFELGSIFISPWSKGDDPPGVKDAQDQKILVSGDVWAGQLARAWVRPFCYDTSGNRGVNLYLKSVQIVKSDGMKRLDNKKELTFADADNSQMAALGIDPTAAAEAPAPGW